VERVPLTRSRLLIAGLALGICAAVCAAVFAAGFDVGALWTRHSMTETSAAMAVADRAVCSHVQPGPLGASGDWRSPDVAKVAYFQASPSVRDAYAAADAATIPLSATPEQMQSVVTAWGKLGNVCAAVNAQAP
jgi:hypothetical protein